MRQAKSFPDVKIVTVLLRPWLEIRATHVWSLRRVVAASWCEPSPPSLQKTFQQLGGETLSGEFRVLANDTTRLLLKWPEAIPPSVIGCNLEFALASRGGNPAAVRRTVKAVWPITH